MSLRRATWPAWLMESNIVFGSASGFPGTAAVTTAPGSTPGLRRSSEVPTYWPSGVWPGSCMIELTEFTAFRIVTLLTVPMLVDVEPPPAIVGLGAPVIRNTPDPAAPSVAIHSNCAPDESTFGPVVLRVCTVDWPFSGSMIVSVSWPGVASATTVPERTV